MLAIKLKRIGKKHQATFRVIVAEKRSKLNGRFIEDLGWVNPHAHTSEIKKELAKKWISQGAQPTQTVHNLLVKNGVIDAPKIPVHKKSKKTEKIETA
jgi:small subunit ribosomal protein S16